MSTAKTLTLDELRRLLDEAAGDSMAADVGRDISDEPFADLGYDSLVMLELIGRISRAYAVQLPDEVLEEAHTPRELLLYVNESLAKV